MNRKLLQWGGIILIAIVALFLFEFFVPKSLFSKPQYTVFSVTKGESEQDIIDALSKQKLIRSPLFFKLYVAATDNRKKLQAGNYRLTNHMNTAKIATAIATGQSMKEYFTVIEGWKLTDIAHELEKRNIVSAKDFLAAANKDWTQDFPLLKTTGKKKGLEGFLFPDTYEVSPGKEPDHLIESALANFEKKLSPELQREIATQKKTNFQILVMASILEKEANNMADKKIIAGILWKRIAAGMPLQADATVNYVTGKSDAKAASADTSINSPYNTYKYYGLPPGPISNPGLESILAAIRPVASSYWYYLAADGTGKTIFSATFAEHQAAMRKYFGS